MTGTEDAMNDAPETDRSETDREVKADALPETEGNGVDEERLAALADELAAAIAATIADAARSGNDCGDGLVWTTAVEDVTHNRTGLPLERAEEAA